MITFFHYLFRDDRIPIKVKCAYSIIWGIRNSEYSMIQIENFLFQFSKFLLSIVFEIWHD